MHVCVCMCVVKILESLFMGFKQQEYIIIKEGGENVKLLIYQIFIIFTVKFCMKLLTIQIVRQSTILFMNSLKLS